MRVLMFAQLRDVVGAAAAEVDAPRALTGRELWERLIAAHPALAAHRGTARLARNGEYAGPDTVLDPADEVALIPPVSGG